MAVTALHTEGRRRALLLALAIAAVVVHLFLVLRHFPLSTFWAGDLLYSNDLSIHFAHVAEGRRFINEGVWTRGYSPTFMAGYNWGIWNSAGRRLYELGGVLGSVMSLPRAFYLIVVIVAFITPLFVPLASRLAGQSIGACCLCTCMVIAAYQLLDPLNCMWQWGMLTFPLASALAAVFLGALVSGIARRSSMLLGIAGVAAAAAFWTHPVAMVAIVIACGSALVLQRRKLLDAGLWLRLLLAGGMSLVLVIPWLWPLMQSWHMRTPMLAGRSLFVSGWKYAVMDLLSDRAFRDPYDRRSILHVLLVLSALGAYAGYRRRDERLLAFALSGWLLLVATYAAPYSGFLRELQPYRFLAAAVLFLAVPAGVGLLELWERVRMSNRHGLVAVLAVGVILAPALLAHGFDLLERKPVARWSPEDEVVELIRTGGGGNGRILCDAPWLGNVLPYFTGRDVIGGRLSQWAILPTQWTAVRDDDEAQYAAFAPAMPPAKLSQRLSLYNIEVAVIRSDSLVDKMSSLGNVCTKLGEVGKLVVYTVKPPDGGYIIGDDGGARAVAGPGRITVEGAPRGQFTLKYHYAETLVAEDGVTIKPVLLDEDPVPFIQVDNSLGRHNVVITDG